MDAIVITLDGPAGSGKSTAARLLARRLGLEFLDTGAMYRAITALCLDAKIDPESSPDAVGEVAEHSKLNFDWSQDPPRLHAVVEGEDRDMTPRLRDSDVAEKVSAVAQLKAVRSQLVEAQRRIGCEHPRLVSEGRDQGSVVFPQAQVKFYIDASSHVRAKRRAEQLRDAGKEADERRILQKIRARDRRDASRADGPLICPADAIRIDTSAMSLDEVVDCLAGHVQRLVGDRLSDRADAVEANDSGSGG